MKQRIEILEDEWSIESRKFILENAGIGKENSVAQFVPDDNLHKLGGTFLTTSGDGEDKVAIFSLDEYFGNQQISAIKADVEGYEYPMIQGASHIISVEKPRLAICLYHNALDLFRIPLKIKEICPEYNIIVRQHDCSILDTVLYAYIRL